MEKKKTAQKRRPVGTLLDPSAPINKIEFDPEMKTSRPGKVALTTEQLNEVLNVMQRIHRGQSMRRHQPKLRRGKEIASHRIANMTTLMRRSRHKAIDLLRAKVAGDRGKHYSDLPLADRATIDKFIEKRKKMIARLAQRLLPKVRKAEYARISSFHKGHPIKSLHTEEIMEMMICDFIDKNVPVSAFASIIEKSNHTGIPYEILENVLFRGMLSTGNQNKAFDRVNAFIAGGRTAMNEDYDLYQEVINRRNINETFSKSYGPVEIGTDEMADRFKRETPGQSPDPNTKFKRKFKKDE